MTQRMLSSLRMLAFGHFVITYCHACATKQFSLLFVAVLSAAVGGACTALKANKEGIWTH
jgi:hypothetical protein